MRCRRVVATGAVQDSPETALRVGKRGTDFEAEVIHARLLDDIKRFPFGLAFGFRSGAGDIDGDQSFDFRMQMHWDFVHPQRFDRCFQDNLIAIGIEPASRNRGGDVTRRDRTIKMTLSRPLGGS